MSKAPAVRALTNADVVTAELSATDNAVLDSIQTATELIDDAVYVDDADWTDNTSKHLLVGGVYQSTPHTVTDGDVSPFQVDSGGRQIAKLAANSGVDIGDVDVTSVVPGVAATSLGKAEDAQHSSGDVGVMALGVGNTDHTALAAKMDYIPINVDLEGCVVVVGNIAHGTTDADPPIKIGGKASSTVPAAVDANDRVNAWMDLNGRQIVAGGAALDAATSTSGNPVVIGGKSLALGSATTDVDADADVTNLLTTRGGRLYVETCRPAFWTSCHEETGAVTNHSIKAASGSAATSLYITDIMFNAAVAATLKLLDGSGGTVLFGLPAIAANGGADVNLPTPIKLTANTALCATTTGAGNATITVCGFTAAP